MQKRIQNKIHGMVWKAKHAYDDMVRTNTFNAERLDVIFSSLSDIEVPIEQKKHRVPGTIPIYVFNLCFYHDDYYYGRQERNKDNKHIPVYQTSGTLFPNHTQPLYEVTPIFVSESIINIATVQAKSPRKVVNTKLEPNNTVTKKKSIEKKKMPNGAEMEIVSMTVLESIEKIPKYRFYSIKRKFTAPRRSIRAQTNAD